MAVPWSGAGAGKARRISRPDLAGFIEGEAGKEFVEGADYTQKARPRKPANGQETAELPQQPGANDPAQA